nr:hypothetical protein GCM10020185_36470 [Pseudomonas brassicacearum subsp. brassicacearum]
MPVNVAVDQLADARQGLVRLQAVGTGLFTGEGDLLLQPGDADLEKNSSRLLEKISRNFNRSSSG